MEGLIRQLLTLPQLQELTAGMDGREKHSMITGLSPVQRAAVAAAAASRTLSRPAVPCSRPVGRSAPAWALPSWKAL